MTEDRGRKKDDIGQRTEGRRHVEIIYIIAGDIGDGGLKKKFI